VVEYTVAAPKIQRAKFHKFERFSIKMQLHIDNLDGAGTRDYTAKIDASRTPRVVRKLNDVSELRFSLIFVGGSFIVPVQGGRVMLGRANGQRVFSGYIVSVAGFEYLGWGGGGGTDGYN